MDELRRIRELKRRLLLLEAREGDILSFTRYTKPDYQVNWHHRVKAKWLNKFIKREIRFLMIFEPPRHGKTELTSRRLPALLHGLYPNDEILAASYNSELAAAMTIDVQRIMDRPDYHEIFPTVRIMPDGKAGRWSRNSNEHEVLPWQDPKTRLWYWYTGSYRSAGIGGAFTGLGGHWLIVDDPIKNREDADSPAFRKKLWDFWTNTMRTRMEGEGSALITHTRWHKEDLAGMLLALQDKDPKADHYKVLSFPAIKEGPPTEDDPREEGEPLWPQKMPLTELEAIKPLDSRGWGSLWQQRPFELGGNIIKGAYFKRYSALPRLKYRVIYGDTAQKTKEHNDFSVLACWGLGYDGYAYLIDLVRGKWESPELKRRTRDFWNKHSDQDAWPVDKYGFLRKIMVEDKSSGTDLIQTLKVGEPRLNEDPIPIEGIERDRDKYTRVQDVLPMLEQGLVWIPESAPFITDFIGEHEAFTANDTHDFDDQVDTTVDACVDLLSNSNKLNTWERLGG